MTVLLVIGGLLLVLALACLWEARSGRPQWGAHLGSNDSLTTAAAAKAAKRGIATTVALGVVLGADGGADG